MDKKTKDRKKTHRNNSVLYRATCRLCYSRKLTNILSLGRHYLSDFLTSNKKLKKYPLKLVICERCLLVQLRHTVSPQSLYTKRYGYRSGINSTMKKELKEVVEKTLPRITFSPKEKIIALDIGANDGTLLSNYKKSVFRIGVEPIKKFAKEAKEHADVVVNDFFNLKAVRKKIGKKKPHIITAISCFYDIDGPNDFIKDIKELLHKKGVFVIQQNYLVEMLKQNAFDNIVHEHLEYYSLLSLEALLARHQLEVFDVEMSDINGGSFRTYIVHKGTKKIRKSVLQLRKKEKNFGLHKKKTYKDFAKRVEMNSKKLYVLIKKLTKKEKKVYIYGASTRGNTLLQYCGLGSSLIKAAVERNPEKWGKKIASVGIPIISEEQARKEKPDYMLVLPWFFKEEFLKREKAYLDRGGHFIFSLPTLEII